MKKILSLDGGGIRGIIPALILQEIEEKIKTNTAGIFDLIAGTSTGGILALGLSKKGDGGIQKHYSAEELAEIYRTRGTDIFKRSSEENTDFSGKLISFGRDLLSIGEEIASSNPSVSDHVKRVRDVASHIEGLTDERYSHEGLVEVLGCYFGDDTLEDVRADTKVMVTCYDIQARCPVFLKNWYPRHQSIRMVDAARATSAAPTYFEPVELEIGHNRHVLVDGGIFVNAPMVSAYAEARRIFPDEEDFFVLSLGTGVFTKSFTYNEAKDWGKLEWVSPLIDCIFDGVQDAADYQMNCLLGSKNYFRLTAELNDNNDEMDDASDQNIRELIKIADQIIESNNFGRLLNRLNQLVCLD